MVRFKTGDILAEDVEVLVNAVNCVGIMGRGIALQFKRAFPENFSAYAEACKRGEVKPGSMFVFETCALTNPKYIVNFPTKRHWRGASRIEDIEAGLADLARLIRERNIREIAVPPLGSGLGGLEWTEVRQLIQDVLRDFEDLDAVIFEPSEEFAAVRNVRNREPPKMTEGRAALVGLMHRYLNGLLDPFVTLLEVHKLMYFLQVAGQPLRLKFTKGRYGPYAENLRHVLRSIDGHFISGYADGGDAPDEPLELVPGAIENAETILERSLATRQRFEKVASLIEGFESPFGLELLSTVHWILENDGPSSRVELVDSIYRWHESKKQFSPRQIELAVDVLTEKRWRANSCSLLSDDEARARR